MIINGKINYNVTFSADVSDRAFQMLQIAVDQRELLAKAASQVSPLLTAALKTAFMKLSFIGIQVKILSSEISIVPTEETGH